MLTPVEWTIASPAWAEAIGLLPVGHALLLCVDDDGKRWTLASLDLAYVSELAKSSPEEVEIDPAMFPWSRRGWPGEFE